MPRPKKKPSTVSLSIEQALPITPPPVALEYKDRQRLAEILDDPVFVQAWRNLHHHRPSPFPMGLNGALGATIANNRLHELRGWMMFEAALIAQARDPIMVPPLLKETYPDSAVPGGVVSR